MFLLVFHLLEYLSIVLDVSKLDILWNQTDKDPE